MAESAAAQTGSPSVTAGETTQRAERPAVDVRKEQLAQTKRILDLQIEGSRAVYRDALSVFIANVLVVAGLVVAGLLVTALGGMPTTTSSLFSVVLLGFGTLSIFVAMAYATKVYLGDIADYSRPVSDVDGSDYVDRSLSKNVSTIKRNAKSMEAKVESMRTAMLSMLGGLGGLSLALGFQVVPLNSWAQILVSLNALVVVSYLLFHGVGSDYFQSHKDRLLR